MLVQALTEEPDAAVGGVAPPRAAGGLHRRQERALCAGADAARPHRDAAGPLRRPAGRVFAARFRRGATSGIRTGPRRTVHFFASRLKYSRWAEVTLVSDERVETLVRALVDHFAAFGGIPLVAVFDRPKTMALQVGPRRRRHGVESDVCRRRARPRDRRRSVLAVPARKRKGSVENLVGWVKGSFFKQRRFLDREDLERQLREWLTEANTDAAVARHRRAARGADRARSARGCGR